MLKKYEYIHYYSWVYVRSNIFLLIVIIYKYLIFRLMVN